MTTQPPDNEGEKTPFDMAYPFRNLFRRTGPTPEEHTDVGPQSEGGVHDGTLEQPPFAGRGAPDTIVGADRVLARKAFTMTPSSTNVVNMPAGVPRQALGFAASTLRIDNVTHQWFWHPATQQWIPPGQIGVVIRLDQLEVAEIQALTPTGATSGTSAAGEFATAIFEQSRFEPTPGVNVFQTAFSGQLDTPSDGETNPTLIPPVVNFPKVWNPTGSVWDRMRAAASDAMSATIAPLAAGLMAFDGITWNRIRSATADALAITGVIAAAQELWNGASFDRARNNLAITLAASAVRTTTLTVANQTSFNNKYLHLIIDVTVMASGGLTPVIYGVDPASGKSYPLLQPSKITGTGTYVYKIGPGFGQIANNAAADILPRTWNVVVTPDDATSITYSVGANVDA